MSPPDNELLIEQEGAVEIVTLNRPHALNALNRSMTLRLGHYFEALAQRPEVRVVVLKANGRAFCAGLDLKAWEQPQGVSTARHGFNTQRAIGNIYRAMRACPQPIIGIAQGAACGGGLSLLLAADIRYGAPDLRLNAAFIKVGLSGCDMGASYFLPRLVGGALAAEMLLTGRFIDAARALRQGLISDIVEPSALLASAMAMAQDMLATAPQGLRMTKELLNLNLDAPGLEAAMNAEDRQQALLVTTQDHQEAVAAFREKRAPRFTDN